MITPLTREMFVSFCDYPPEVSLRGLAVVHESRVMGVIAVSLINGRNFILCNIADDINKRDILRGWRAFKSMLDPSRLYFAVRDEEIKASESFVSHFGFEKFHDDIYIYRGY